VANEGTGVPELAKAIADYQQFLEKQNLLLKKRLGNWRERLIEMLRERLLERIVRERMDEETLIQYAREITEHQRDPYTLVEEIVNGVCK
jgi:putative protein kinase ArgK-like GTPase of G3E family